MGSQRGTHSTILCLLLTFLVSSLIGRVVGAEVAEDASATGSQVSKAAGPLAFFLQDPTTGMCLGGATYRRCSIETLWYVSGKPGSYSIHHRNADESDEDDLCLGKAQCHLDESPAQLANCGHCGAKKWNIVGDNDTGYFLTEDSNKNCIKRVGDKATVIKCDKGSSSMSLQCKFTKEWQRRLVAMGALFFWTVLTYTVTSNILHFSRDESPHYCNE